MDNIAHHNHKVLKIQNTLKETDGEIALSRKSVRHCLRDLTYKENRSLIDVSSLCDIVSIDLKNKTITVEPSVTMEQLLDFTLTQGYRIPVITEFKGMTIGGAINGLAGESSCIHYGLLHETCISYEALTAKGELLNVSRTENSDLFYAIPGSYGSLCIFTSITLPLVPTTKYVEVKYYQMEKLSVKSFSDDCSATFRDAIMLEPNKYVIMDAYETPDNPKVTLELESKSSPWFYEHVKSQVQAGAKSDIMSLKDYIFRYDKGSFWVASKKIQYNFITRFLMGNKLSTDDLYSKTLQGTSAADRERNKIFQDVMIPTSNFETYLQYLDQHFGIYPLWLLPIKNYDQGNYLFSLSQNPERYINIGSYAKVNRTPYFFVPENRALQALITKLGGKKTLYSQSYYTEEEFWQNYDKKAYLTLRKKYKAEGKLIDIYTKTNDLYLHLTKSVEEEVKNSPKSQKISLLKDARSSHTLHNMTYKKDAHLVRYQHLQEVLDFDIENKTIIVQPQMSMEKLLNYTLQYQLMPPVIPEFLSLTVGGVVQGAGLESSSFKFGQFNDNCIEYTIVTAEGKTIVASASKNPDIFYGISGSYGSFGILTSVKIQLIPAQKFVIVDYEWFESTEKAIDALIKYQKQNECDFLEGVMLNDGFWVMRGFLSDQKPEDISLKQFTRSYDPWFYRYLVELKDKNSLVHKDVMPLFDYLFRYDRGCFWTGDYAMNKIIGGYNIISRTLLNKHFTTAALYKRFHSKDEKEREQKYIIQDCYIPHENVAKFISYIKDRFDITPLWICPIKSSQKPQKLAPHYNKSKLMINVGVYGRPKKTVKDMISVNHELEQMVKELGGRKMFYAYSYYTQEDFWSIYDGSWYQEIKTKYDPNGKFFNITDKVLRQGDGKLISK